MSAGHGIRHRRLRLHRRPADPRGWSARAGACARWRGRTRSAAKVVGARRRAGRGATSATSAAMRAGADGLPSTRSTPPPTSASGARARSSSATTSTGTRNALEAAARRACGGSCTSAPRPRCWPGEPLVNVNEDAPLRPDSKALYPATKAMAEQAVRDANGDGFETVVVRPRLVWGPGDTTILPALAAAIERGRFAWIGGGRHLTSTTHVDNIVEGLVLGADARPARRRLLRHRRRAGRVPRVHHASCSRRRASSRPTATCPRRSRASPPTAPRASGGRSV